MVLQRVGQLCVSILHTTSSDTAGAYSPSGTTPIISPPLSLLCRVGHSAVLSFLRFGRLGPSCQASSRSAYWSWPKLVFFLSFLKSKANQTNHKEANLVVEYWGRNDELDGRFSPAKLWLVADTNVAPPRFFIWHSWLASSLVVFSNRSPLFLLAFFFFFQCTLLSILATEPLYMYSIPPSLEANLDSGLLDLDILGRLCRAKQQHTARDTGKAAGAVF